MDALEFFKATLPSVGVYYLVLFRQGNPLPQHVAYTTLEDMAAGVDKIAANTHYQVYHACASYKAPYYEAPDPKDPTKIKKKFRGVPNQSHARAFWVDLDCGQAKYDEGKGYLTQRDAALALKAFCNTIGLPMPMLVNSGWGVHGYWPLDRDVPAEKWKPVAETLKACMQHAGLIIDPTRTGDFASILRPPGGVNRKGEPRVVDVRSECDPVHPRDILQAVAAYKSEHDVKVVRQAPAPVSGLNSELTGLLEQQYPPQDTSGELCADQCQQMAAMRDTLGDVSYPVWFNVIGVLKHCVDGEQLAEAWTANREATGHSQLDWRMRWDTWSTGPTTCARFEADNPQGCVGCPHRGNITTPMEVGRVIPEEKMELVSTDEGQELQVDLPKGYEWIPGYHGGRLVYHHKTPDGIVEVRPFCSHLVWPVGWVHEDSVYSVQMNALMPGNKINAFTIPYGDTASPADLAKALAKKGAVSITTGESQNAGKYMVGYMQAQLQRLQAQQEQQNTHKTYGWTEDMDGFLIGDRLYRPDGSVSKVLTGGNATALTRALPPPRGTLSGYANAINRIYNRSGMEWAQFAICSGYGSILSALGEDLYKGVIVALQGGSTGRGKTTACQASLFAFGDATEMTLGGKDGFTVTGLWQTVSTMNNIPVLVDELTNVDPRDFSNMTYGISNGRDKQRSHAGNSGVVLAERARWCMSPFITGNMDFHGVLAANQANSQAEAVRLVQINVDRYPEVLLSPFPDKATAMIRQAVKEMRENMGSAGDAMIRYAVSHVQDLRERVEKTIDELAIDMPGTKYRFYRNHAACTLVMADVASQLEIIDFDLDALRLFTVDMLKDLAESVADMNTVTPEDSFNKLLMYMGPHTIVTAEMGDGRKGYAETPRYKPSGEIWGRLVFGTPQQPDLRVVLDISKVREWCVRTRVDYKAMVVALQLKGALVGDPRGSRVSLTRGTDVPQQVQTPCLVVDLKKLDKGAVLTLVSMNPVDPNAANAV